MQDLLERELPLSGNSGAKFYVSEKLEIVIHRLEETFKGQDYIAIKPEELALMNAAMAQSVAEISDYEEDS